MRKFKAVTIEAEGRDKGKTFLTVEMSAWAMEKWAAKALLALGRAGAEIPEDAVRAGALGVLIAGFQGFQRMRFEDAEPLLDDMLGCISFVPDRTRVDSITGRPVVRPLIRSDTTNDGDIEELATLLMLRGEALELHLGFSVTDMLSSLAVASQASTPPLTPTSRKRAGPSSRKARQAS